MSQTILIIIGIVIVALLLSRKTRENVVGICAVALDQTVRKNGNKAKIVEVLGAKGELSNSDICEALGVSERTAAARTMGLRLKKAQERVLALESEPQPELEPGLVLVLFLRS